MASRKFVMGLGTGLLTASLLATFGYMSALTEMTKSEAETKAQPTQGISLEEKFDRRKDGEDTDPNDLKLSTETDRSIMPDTADAQADDVKTKVVFAEGGTPEGVAFVLYDAGLIDNMENFLQYLHAKGAQKGYKKGNLYIDKGLSYEELWQEIIE